MLLSHCTAAPIKLNNLEKRLSKGFSNQKQTKQNSLEFMVVQTKIDRIVGAMPHAGVSMLKQAKTCTVSSARNNH